MLQLLFTLFSLFIFVAFLGFAIWVGVAMLVIFFVGGIVLAIFLVLRGYYLSWKYKDGVQVQKTTKTSTFDNNSDTTHHETTIIDVEYKDL